MVCRPSIARASNRCGRCRPRRERRPRRCWSRSAVALSATAWAAAASRPQRRRYRILPRNALISPNMLRVLSSGHARGSAARVAPVSVLRATAEPSESTVGRRRPLGSLPTERRRSGRRCRLLRGFGLLRLAAAPLLALGHGHSPTLGARRSFGAGGLGPRRAVPLIAPAQARQPGADPRCPRTRCKATRSRWPSEPAACRAQSPQSAHASWRNKRAGPPA